MTDQRDPDTLLTRSEAAAVLTEAGFRTAPATLATMATRGGGPPFQKYGPRPLYRLGDALAWARARLITPSPAGKQRNSESQPHHESAAL
jgi:predicted component of type VI protein secretion system